MVINIYNILLIVSFNWKKILRLVMNITSYALITPIEKLLNHDNAPIHTSLLTYNY